MRPIKCADLSLFEHDENETIIGEIVRHPIGYVFIALNAIFITLVLMLAMYLLIRNQDSLINIISTESTIDITNLVTLVTMILVLLVLVGSAFSVYVYNNNYLVLTDSKLVLVTTYSIIRRRVSQLSIGDIQDVTIVQNSFLCRLFKFGTINIETAGEQANFSFPYARYPFEAAKYITEAHEENLKLYGN